MSEPWIDPNKARHHPLFGKMDKRAAWEINQALLAQRPTIAQLDELALEELSGKDRSSVYLVLDQFVPRPRP